LESLALDSPGNANPSTGCDMQGAAAAVLAEEALRADTWMTAPGSPRHEGSDCTAWLGCFVGKLLTTRSPGLPLLLLLHLLVLEYLS